jgi:curli production assembly/transport component CsgG
MRLSVVTRSITGFALALTLHGCTLFVGKEPLPPMPETASLTPHAGTFRDLVRLPLPRGKIPVSVYTFKDYTGQFKQAPASSFSSAVTQGGTALLTQALLDSGWFIPVERDGLNDLLTERKVIRGAQQQQTDNLPPLLGASLMLQGGIVGYESNVKTGGAGVRYFGIGANDLYRMDQVTVSLRAVDIRTGQVINSVSTTKTVYSYEYDIGVFRFVSFKRLLEAEAGITRNEPALLCVQDAVEAAVIHLVVQGLKSNSWQLADKDELSSPILAPYLEAQSTLYAR